MNRLAVISYTEKSYYGYESIKTMVCMLKDVDIYGGIINVEDAITNRTAVIKSEQIEAIEYAVI